MEQTLELMITRFPLWYHYESARWISILYRTASSKLMVETGSTLLPGVIHITASVGTKTMHAKANDTGFAESQSNRGLTTHQRFPHRVASSSLWQFTVARSRFGCGGSERTGHLLVLLPHDGNAYLTIVNDLSVLREVVRHLVKSCNPSNSVHSCIDRALSQQDICTDK